jgi:DNA-binding ferritin-like protein
MTAKTTAPVEQASSASSPTATPSTSRKVIEAAEPAADFASADLDTRRMDVHDKNAWMLRSHLE